MYTRLHSSRKAKGKGDQVGFRQEHRDEERCLEAQTCKREKRSSAGSSGMSMLRTSTGERHAVGQTNGQAGEQTVVRHFNVLVNISMPHLILLY